MMFPRFLIARIGPGEVVGTVTTTTHGKERWIGDGCLGYLLSEMKFVRGRWHMREESWGFTPDEPVAFDALHAGSEWFVLDGYWGERAELVLDDDRVWESSRYEGSDHDHCAICWEKLGVGGEPTGYVSGGKTWVCSHCYEAFVARRSLNFVPNP